MTDRYRWLGPTPQDRTVVLVPQAPYHLLELNQLAARLVERNIAAALAVPVVSWKPLHRFRPTVRRLAATVSASKLKLTSTISVADLADRSAAVVVMNDWGVPKHLVETARRREVPTFGWVEGVQDYDDVDTKLNRHAYRQVDHVFALGPASCDILGQGRCTTVGSERLSALWRLSDLPDGEGVLINSNFTYGVLNGTRSSWTEGVVKACDTAHQPWTLSRHQAERGRSPYKATDRPIDELLLEAERLVSRFSTVNLDALVLGLELIYHNPHGERVATFLNPQGAFEHTTSTDELTDVLRRPARPRHEIRAAAAAFVEHLVLLDDSSTPAERAAKVIVDRIG